MTVRVFLVDDHDVVRRGLREIIEAEHDLTVVGEAASAREALEFLPAVNPDVAVLDVAMPRGVEGIELCRELRSRNDKLIILMLSALGDEETVLAAVMAGAAGYVLKNLRTPDLVDAIRRVAAHESLFDPLMTQRLVERAHPDTSSGDELHRLTQQEHRILALVAEGLTNRQIAERIFLSEKTVKNYVSSMLSKLGMRRRTEAAVYATRRLHRGL